VVAGMCRLRHGEKRSGAGGQENCPVGGFHVCVRRGGRTQQSDFEDPGHPKVDTPGQRRERAGSGESISSLAVFGWRT